MGMCKQMILAILIIPVALGAEPKLQIFVILVRLPADSTFMPGNMRIAFDVLLKLCPPLHLLWRHMNTTSGSQEENHKIKQ